jgi:hypothetical protein
MSLNHFSKMFSTTRKANKLVTFQVWHKLNYFLICQIFWILIVSSNEFLKNSCNQPILIFEPLLVTFRNNVLAT